MDKSEKKCMSLGKFEQKKKDFYHAFHTSLMILVLWVVYISGERYEKQAYGVFHLLRDPSYTLACIISSDLQLTREGKTTYTHSRTLV